MKDNLPREEERNWKLGIFYVNQEDPALWVPKRFSPGKTVNLGHPEGWLILAGVGLLLSIALTPLVLTILTFH